MATDETLYSATLAGIPIKCMTAEDGFEKAISRQETPYVNGAQTDDLGLKARTVSLRCFFSDETYENHARILAAVKSLELLELVHPVYGLLKVRVERVVVRHDDGVQTAELEIGLVEDASPAVLIMPWESVKAQVEQEFEESVAEQKRSVLQRITALGAKGAALCEVVIGRFEALLDGIANPANRLASLVDYGTDLPGRFVEAAAKAAERYAIAYQALRAAPAAFQSSLAAALLELAAAAEGFEDQAAAAGAARLAVEAADFYYTDEQARAGNSRAERRPGFDILGRRVGAELTTTLNAIEIERLLELSNTAAQSALRGDRGNAAIKRMAADLYTAAARLKRSAENVKAVRVNDPTPLHVLCLQYGLPYNAAPRVLALNPQIKDPNRVSGEILIYA